MDPLKRRCVKLKISQLLPPDKMVILRSAVAAIHTVATMASLLLKRFYLTEHLGADDAAYNIDDDLVLMCYEVVQNVRPGTRQKQGDDQGGSAAKDAKARKDDERRTLMYRLERCYAHMLVAYAPRVQGSASHIYYAMAEACVTAYKNNVAAHYEDYLWRLGKAVVTTERVGHDDNAALKSAMTHLVQYLRDGGAVESPSHEALRARLRVPVRAPAVSLAYDTKARPWLYQRTMVLAMRELRAMHRVNQAADEDKQVRCHVFKLLSLFPLVTSFIPNHIPLCMSAMIQLLGSKEDVNRFKALYLAEHGITLQVNTLGDVGKSFEKATGRAAHSPHEEAMYFTRLWETVCDFDRKKAYKELVGTGTARLATGTRLRGSPRDMEEVWCFDNRIATDGYSVSFSIVSENQLRKKNRVVERQLAQRAKAEAKAAGPHPEFEVLSPATTAALEGLLDKNRYKLVAVDPGIGNLAAVNDGARVVTYSSAQRVVETRSAQRKRRADAVRLDELGERPVRGTFFGQRLLQVGDATGVSGRRLQRKQRRTVLEEREWTDPSVATYETAVLSAVSSRTCDVGEFDEYVRRQEAMSQAGRACYERPVFRNQRFEAYTLRRSSEDKFIGRLREAFSPPSLAASAEPPAPATRLKRDRRHAWMAEQAAQGVAALEYINESLEVNSCRELVLVYGNWGRNPNLKGTKPTPGIGLRRVLDRCFRTLTLWEAYTSQVCPCCHRWGLVYARLTGAERDSAEKHHLLRCEIGCGRLWNRDSAATMNQLVKGVSPLQGCPTENGWFDE